MSITVINAIFPVCTYSIYASRSNTVTLSLVLGHQNKKISIHKNGKHTAELDKKYGAIHICSVSNMPEGNSYFRFTLLVPKRLVMHARGVLACAVYVPSPHLARIENVVKVM